MDGGKEERERTKGKIKITIKSKQDELEEHDDHHQQETTTTTTTNLKKQKRRKKKRRKKRKKERNRSDGITYDGFQSNNVGAMVNVVNAMPKYGSGLVTCHVHHLRHELQQRLPVGTKGEVIPVEQHQAGLKIAHGAQNAEEPKEGKPLLVDRDVVQNARHAEPVVTATRSAGHAGQTRVVERHAVGRRPHRNLSEQYGGRSLVAHEIGLESGPADHSLDVPVAGEETGVGRKSGR